MLLRMYLNWISGLADSTNSHVGAENLTKQVLGSPVFILCHVIIRSLFSGALLWLKLHSNLYEV